MWWRATWGQNSEVGLRVKGGWEHDLLVSACEASGTMQLISIDDYPFCTSTCGYLAYTMLAVSGLGYSDCLYSV